MKHFFETINKAGDWSLRRRSGHQIKAAQRIFTVVHKCFLLPLCLAVGFNQAFAGYVGESFLQVPGVDGGWPGESYRNWMKFESREWTETPVCEARQKNPNALVCDEQFWRPKQSRLIFSAPLAPPSGGGKLSVAMDKNSPDYPQLMKLCKSGNPLKELVYAESSQRARRLGEVGTVPEEVPEYFEYRLLQVQLACPEVEAAPEQAFVLSFEDIKWLNYKHTEALTLTAEPARLAPLPANGSSKTFLLTWIEAGGAYRPDDCPQLNTEPGEGDYFALWPASAIDAGKAELQRKGGLATLRAGISLRGPDRLNVCALPGIVPDPGHFAPQSPVARGFNLDGFDGEGRPPEGVHQHVNFVDEQGRKGIDNQVYRVEGCVPGFRPGGNIPKVSNSMMHNGSVTVLLNISGIDDEDNDDHVIVTVLYSKDLMVKTADGSDILPNYTFRLSDNPEFTQFQQSFVGRIRDGVVTTDKLEEMIFQEGGQSGFRLYEAHMRIEFKPDGKIRAVLGGYQDWRRRFNNWSRARILEGTMRFQCPALYYAYKRAADGLLDPVTGEFGGISIAYDIDGVKAYIPPDEFSALVAKPELASDK